MVFGDELSNGFVKYWEILMQFHMVPIDYNASVYAFGPNTVYSRERWSGVWNGHGLIIIDVS